MSLSYIAFQKYSSVIEMLFSLANFDKSCSNSKE
uniref:Uncharacterized protein n=1 Tax=Rhizophora mucronata TaxID=61149 RepID=A0A2P2P235_RHIMU